MSLKLKKLLNESILGDLPSSKMFKFNKDSGKFESPASRTSTNESSEESVDEAIKPGLERAYVDAEDAFEELQGRLEVLIGQINSKKPKTQEDVIMQAKVSVILKKLTKLESEFLNIDFPTE